MNTMAAPNPSDSQLVKTVSLPCLGKETLPEMDASSTASLSQPFISYCAVRLINYVVSLPAADQFIILLL